MPDASKQKANGHLQMPDEDSESDGEVPDDAGPVAGTDNLSQQSVSEMSEEELPHAPDLRKKSFFSVGRRRKQSIGSEAHLGSASSALPGRFQ